MDSPKFITPFPMGVYGRRESGKTHFVTELLIQQEKLIKDPFTKVIWINKSFQKDVYEKLMRANQFELEFLDDIPNFDEMGKQIRNTLVVLDDMLTESNRNEQISALFTRGRHLNISVILLSQNLFHQGKYSRDISLNVDYIVLFRNTRDTGQIMTLAQQMYPRVKKFLPWAYHDAVEKENFSHLILDLKPYTNSVMRVCAKIFDLFPIVYIPRKL